MLKILLLAIALPACGPASVPEPPTATLLPQKPSSRQVERHGITWTFDKKYNTGTFVGGDPWVRGPVRIRKRR